MKPEQEIAAVVKRLGTENKKLLVRFAKALESMPAGEDGSRTSFNRKRWAGAFSRDDVAEMEEAIRDCEKVDEAGWR